MESLTRGMWFSREGIIMIRKLMSLGITKYFVTSCSAGVIDFGIAYLLFKLGLVNYLMSCNIGIILGFVFQYLICRLYIFNQGNFYNFFIIYIVTFLIGFALADAVMLLSFNILKLSFIISKALSMALPFFIIYFIRKGLLGLKINKGTVK